LLFPVASKAIIPAPLKKLVSAAGFKLKGSGWYETDFKHSGKPAKKDSKEKKTTAAAAKTTTKKSG
jgi:predicted nucleic acid-binding Zn ribbon protein